MNKKIIVAAAVTAIIAGSAVVYAKGSTVTENSYQPAPAVQSITRDQYNEMMQIKADVRAGKLPQEKADEVDRILKEHQAGIDAVRATHPIERGDVKAVDLNIKAGPNRALIAIEPDLTAQIKKMNASGEYMNKVALVVFLHAMTHQKIKADQIGFSIKMTPVLIEVMLDNIKSSKELTDQERADFLTIVDNWKAGDFAQADKDHNYFWTLQGGTIGKATGINSASEETAFIASRFPDGKQSASAQ